MKNLFYLFQLLITFSSLSQTILTAPNKRNTEGKRVGDWVIGYSKGWKETVTKDSLAFYRVIKFDDNGKPIGKTTDYHLNGKKQWEGVLLEMEPEAIADGLVVWFDDKGEVKNRAFFENGKKVIISELNKKFNELYEAGYFNDAILIAEQSVKITRLIFGEQHHSYATSLNNLAALYENQGRYVQAEPLYLEALAIRKKVLGEQHSSYATSLNNLAALYESQSRYAKAESLYLEALAIIKKNLKEDHPNYANSLNNLAALYESQGRYVKAETLYLEALGIRKKAFGEHHPSYAISLNNLAALYESQGRYVKAETLYLEALGIRKKALGEHHPSYATSLNNLAGLYDSEGRYAKAELLYLEALEIRRKALGEQHPSYAASLNNLGFLHENKGNYAKAEPLYLEALAIIRKALGDQHPEYAQSLNNLAALYGSQGSYAKAETFYLEALVIRKKVLGNQHPEYAQSLNNLAYLYQSQRSYAKAETLYLEALEIRKNALGDQHPEYAQSLNNLASLYKSQGNFTKAEQLFLEALEIRKKVLGELHPDYATSLHNLAGLYIAQKHYNKAVPFYLKGCKIDKSNLLDFFNTSTDQEQKAYLSKNEPSLKVGYSFTNDYKDMRSWAYNNALLIKELRLASAASLQKYLSSSSDTSLVNVFEKYLVAKRSLVVQNSKPIAERVYVKELEEVAEQLEKQLTTKSSMFRNFQETFKISYENIKQKLKPNSVAIEFVDYHYHNGKRWTDTTYYAALLLKPEWTEPKMIHLCEKKQLDQLLNLSNSNEQLAQYLYGNRSGGKVASVSPIVSESVYKLIWQPMDSLLNGVKSIYYAPSGLLHQLNLSAISTKDSITVGQKYNMYRLSSTRQIALKDDFKSLSNYNLLMGDINYDADSISITKANLKLKNNENSLAHRGGNDDNRGTKFKKLDNTGPEIRSIAKYSAASDTLTQEYATEEAFYHGIRKKPKVIHLATHGFFYNAPKDTLSRQQGEPVFVNSTDALLRSGLALAGANKVWEGGKPTTNQADGILTAYEVSLTDMRNTELVVTSACETALGDINGSEGVFGLQRAFKIAGAKNLLMSLWKVNDEATKDYMEIFYRLYLKDGKTIHDAYQLTQNQMKKKYKAPFYWAAFILLE